MSLLRYKIALTAALLTYFCVFYFTLQRVVFFVPRQFTMSALDEWFSFDPRWTIVYQSLYVFLLLPWLAESREQLARYARGFLILTIVSFLFFFAFPIEGPRPDVMANDPFYRLLMTYDRNLNAFPSLHAGLAIYTLLFAFRIRRFAIGAVGIFWTALILLATVITKQHYVIDVVAGVVLAIAADLLAWRAA